MHGALQSKVEWAAEMQLICEHAQARPGHTLQPVDCAAPPAPTPTGPFTPSPALRSCSWELNTNMPDSNPIRQPAGSKEECCGLCFGTSWCVTAIFQIEGGSSCNMHTVADDKPLKPGAGTACVTGRSRAVQRGAQ